MDYNLIVLISARSLSTIMIIVVMFVFFKKNKNIWKLEIKKLFLYFL